MAQTSFTARFPHVLPPKNSPAMLSIFLRCAVALTISIPTRRFLDASILK